MNDPWIAHEWLHDASNFEQLRLARLFMSGLAWLDASVGTVLDTLRHEGLERETLVVATADHGASFLGKGHAYEAGVRVPLIARWPAVMAAGLRSRRTAMLIDVAPSLWAAASGKLRAPHEGRDGPASASPFVTLCHGRPDLFTAAADETEPSAERLVIFEVGYMRGALLWPWKLLLVNDIYDRCAPTAGRGCRNLHGQLVEVAPGPTGATAQAHNASGGKRYGLGSMTYDAPARHAGASTPRLPPLLSLRSHTSQLLTHVATRSSP